jgi:hypothetical protein
VRSIPLPLKVHENRLLRDWVWEEFEGLKLENQDERESIAQNSRWKGALRTKAPIPWLSWVAPD